jgi:hypothetical protein
MPTIIQSLEKRVREIRESIAAQETELTAYEDLLKIEVAANNSEEDEGPMGRATESAASAGVPVTTNKTQMVANIVKSFGKAGASPKEVDNFFAERSIVRNKNMVYNVLSTLAATKKLERRDGRYFAIAEKASTPVKRKISPEGLQRIRDASKKRWAAKKAADKKAKQ